MSIILLDANIVDIGGGGLRIPVLPLQENTAQRG